LRLIAPGGSAPAGLPLVSDDAIIDAIQRRDDRVASEIYDRLFGVADQTLYRVLGQRGPDHDDLVQQVFEQVVLTISRHAFARMCSLKTWAARVATNVGLNALRARRRERKVIDRTLELGTDSPAESGYDPRGAIDSRAELMHVRRLLAEMKPAQVEVLFLHDVLGHGLTEIALMVGASVPATQSRLFRGRRVLREHLEREGRYRRGDEP
jgi:RNA polymerase sigma-70 factor (ECF subfamily)